MIDSTTQCNRVEQIRQLLEEALQPSLLIIHDDSDEHIGHSGHGGAGHFSIEVTAAKLNPLTTIQQHRAIYQALASMMPSEIHALSIKVKA